MEIVSSRRGGKEEEEGRRSWLAMIRTDCMNVSAVSRCPLPFCVTRRSSSTCYTSGEHTRGPDVCENQHARRVAGLFYSRSLLRRRCGQIARRINVSCICRGSSISNRPRVRYVKRAVWSGARSRDHRSARSNGSDCGCIYTCRLHVTMSPPSAVTSLPLASPNATNFRQLSARARLCM
jgi:hypothetical protein